MEFDFGVEQDQVKNPIGNNIKKWPTTGEKTALIDADAIPYICGYTADIQQYLKAKRSNNFQESDAFLAKKNHANYLLNKWITDAGCDSALLYLTNGKDNFRLKIGKTKVYKGQRVSEKPPFFHEIKQWMMDFHGATMSEGCEADDNISIEAWRRHLNFGSLNGKLWTPEHKSFSDFVVVSCDKDLAIIPGWCCPPDKQKKWIDPIGFLEPKWKVRQVTAYEYWPLFKGSPVDLIKCNALIKYQGEIQFKRKEELTCSIDKWELDYLWWHDKKCQDTYLRGIKKGNGKFKRVKVGMRDSEYIDKLKGGGLMFFYSQLLTGDQVDNYPGLPGCGNTKAYELLDGTMSEEEMYNIVFYEYRKKYGSKAYDMLLEQGQLAHMQTYEGELWRHPSEYKRTFPA